MQNFHNASYFCCVESVFIVLENSGCSLGNGGKIKNPIFEHGSNLQASKFQPNKMFILCLLLCDGVGPAPIL
jgi:hypothetical protein